MHWRRKNTSPCILNEIKGNLAASFEGCCVFPVKLSLVSRKVFAAVFKTVSQSSNLTFNEPLVPMCGTRHAQLR